MDQYEIRIFRDDGGTSLILAAIQFDDNTAIQAARNLARTHKFEVWRGMDCIYGAGGATIINLPLRDGTKPDAFG